MTKDEKNKVTSEYKAYNASKNRTDRDSNSPIVVGSVLHLTGLQPFNVGTTFEYYGWTNDENIPLSDKHTGRRGNGLDLKGNTDEERNLALLDEIASSATGKIAVKVVAIDERKRLYDGRETLVSYLKFAKV